MIGWLILVFITGLILGINITYIANKNAIDLYAIILRENRFEKLTSFKNKKPTPENIKEFKEALKKWYGTL